MPPNDPASPPPSPPAASKPSLPGWASATLRGAGWVAALLAGGLFSLLLLVALALAVAYPNLPEIGSLTDYRPKLPLRVFSSDGVQI